MDFHNFECNVNQFLPRCSYVAAVFRQASVRPSVDLYTSVFDRRVLCYLLKFIVHEPLFQLATVFYKRLESFLF